MKNKLLLVLIITLVFIGGCANDSSKKEKEKLIKVMTKEGYFEKDMKYIGISTIEAGRIDNTQLYDKYDVYEKDGKLYSINFDKIHIDSEENPKTCDFIVYYTNNVTILKDQEVSEYDSNKKEFVNVKKDVYKTDTSSMERHCINKKKILNVFEKYVIEYDKLPEK